MSKFETMKKRGKKKRPRKSGAALLGGVEGADEIDGEFLLVGGELGFPLGHAGAGDAVGDGGGGPFGARLLHVEIGGRAGLGGGLRALAVAGFVVAGGAILDEERAGGLEL